MKKPPVCIYTYCLVCHEDTDHTLRDEFDDESLYNCDQCEKHKFYVGKEEYK